MSEVLAAPIEPMDLDDSANLNDADASGDVTEPALDSTNHSQAEADVNVNEEEEELIDIEGIDSPVAFGTVAGAEEESVEEPVPQKRTRKPRQSTSNSADPTESESIAWQAPPTRRAAKAAMTKLSHDFPTPAPPTKSAKTTPKATKVSKPESEVEVKPEKPSRPSTVPADAVKVGRPMATPKLPQEDEEKPPSKRKVTHRQTRTVKPIGFYDERFDALTRRHKATKTATIELEDAIIEGLETSDKVLNGQALIEEIFRPYAKALTSFTQAQVALRRTILLERKLAAEVWGDNNIATFRDGVYTVDCEAIETSLTRPQNLPIPGVTRAYNKRTPKPVNRYVEPTPPTTEKRRRKSERPVKTETETPDTATPQGRSRRKVVPASAEPIGPPIKRLKLKKENIPDSPISSPSVSRSASPIETESRKKAPQAAPSAKPTPMPKFKPVDENIISKKALPFIKDAPVLSCYCTSDSNGDRCDDNCVNRMLHMECGSRCTDNCRNKRFTNKQYAGFEPFFAGAKGWGIRATKPIRTGDFIVEYVGEVVDPVETKKRLKMYTQKGHKHHYMMGLRNNAVIDATTYGNFSRFVNHSCDPNAETQKWVVHKQMRVGFFAKKNIAPGEEIVFDYAFERFGEAAQVCYCGSKNCTGYIGSKPEPGATGGEVDEDDAASLTEESDEAEEDEVEPETSVPTPKPKKPKLTEQEREWRKRCAKARKRLLRWKRDMRKIVGRKKVFSAEDVREFNRQMFNVSEIETRYLLTSYLLTITDESWLKWFVESQGVGIMYTWVTDNLASGKSLRYILRFNVQILELLQRLPVNDPMYFNQLNFLELLKSMSLCVLPEETIIVETVNDLVDNVTREVGDEPPIADKDLARVLKKDGISMLDLHDEMRERAKALFDAWSVVKPPPKAPTPQPEPVSEPEEDEFDSYPIRAHTPDSPPPDEVEVLDNPSPPPKNDDFEPEEHREHERRRSRSTDRYDYDRRRNSQSIYRRGKDRRRSRSRSAERSYYGDRRRHGRGGRDDYRHSRYRSRSRSPYRDDRYDRYDRGGRYHGYDRRHRSSYHRRTSEERYRYRRGGDRSRSPRRDERPRYHDSRDLPKLIDVKIEPPEQHIAYSIFAKTADMPPPLPPRSPPPVVAPVLTAIAPITPAALQKSSAANLDVTNVFELSGGTTATRLPLKIHINGSSATDAAPPLLSAGASKNRRNMPSINLPGTGPKWLPTVQNVGYIAPPPTTTPVPMMVPPPSSTGYGFPPPMLSPYMPPVTAISGAFNPSTPSYYHPSPYYPASMFHPPPPPQPVPAPMPITVTIKEEVMDPSPSSVVSDPVHRPQEEPAEIVVEDDADGEDCAGGAKERVFEANPDWIETSTPDGVIYYYHKETRESMWTEPPPKTETEPANPTPPQCSTDSSQGTSGGEATTTSSEFGGDSQPQQAPIVQKEVKQELMDATPTPSNHDGVQHHHHGHHRPPRRSREYPPDMDKRKRDFKEKVWNHLFPYLKTKSGVETYGSNVLTQYARKMTHRTLDDEIHHGNVKCVVTKEVLAKARHNLDRSFPAFLESNGNIDAV
uniref:SET domain-containing protein n=1 Tax=Panagrellus redivivus TaxID=6233 RepID=A0A7E4UQH8_PANRE